MFVGVVNRTPPPATCQLTREIATFAVPRATIEAAIHQAAPRTYCLSTTAWAAPVTHPATAPTTRGTTTKEGCDGSCIRKPVSFSSHEVTGMEAASSPPTALA